MNLYEKYQTLLRRLMPEHPKLVATMSWDDDAQGRVRTWDLWNPHGSARFSIRESDAADLLTMHALRWALSTPTLIELVKPIKLKDMPFSLSTCDPDGWLDEILAKTKHLEKADAAE